MEFMTLYVNLKCNINKFYNIYCKSLEIEHRDLIPTQSETIV